MFERLRIAPRTSVTTIFGCARQFYLLSTKKYYMDLQKNFKPYFGQVIHSELERNKEFDSDAEFSMEMIKDYAPMGENVFRFTITGTCDSIRISHDLIRDWKFTEKVPYNKYPWPKHTLQINMYRWMLILQNPNAIGIKNLELCYISPSESKICRAKVSDLNDLEKALEKSLEPYYWLFTKGVVPAPNVEKEDKVLCPFCQVEKECYQEYHNIASAKQVDNILGGL